MKSGKLLLTSTGLTSKNVARGFLELLESTQTLPVAIITTAAEGKERNKYSQLAKEQFEGFGFTQIDFIDLENNPEVHFDQYGIIYVCGGNTFKLLKFARDVNFKRVIENLLENNGIYIGVSAGSIIVGPSVQIANEIEPDPNEVDLKDFSGFSIIDLIVLPHYSPDIETQVFGFEKKYNTHVERLDNNQAILIDNGVKSLI